MADQPYHYYAETKPFSLHKYPDPDFISPRHSRSGSPPPQTQPMSGGNQHTLRSGTLNTPNTPNFVHDLSLRLYQSAEADQRDGVNSIASDPRPPHFGSGYSQPMIHDAGSTVSPPLPIAPVPVDGHGVLILNPSLFNGLISQSNAGLFYSVDTIKPPNGITSKSQVVGSQGRRGILPSAPGYPAALEVDQSATKDRDVPVKDDEGKFPCPHCTKKYVHAKHMKRHRLRHTGQRPYRCVLCCDTFTRSDILKCHFDKCSIRRGNPAGATHLSHPLAYVQTSPRTRKIRAYPKSNMNRMLGDDVVYPSGQSSEQFL